MQKDDKEDKKNATVGKGVAFEHLRRITGYLVGDAKTFFNNAKWAELNDRVKHNVK